MIKGYEDKDLIIGCLHAFRRKCNREGNKCNEMDLLPFVFTSEVRHDDGLPDDMAVVFLKGKNTIAVYGVRYTNGKLRFRNLNDTEY